MNLTTFVKQDGTRAFLENLTTVLCELADTTPSIIKNLAEEWQAELDYLKTTREYFTRFLKLPEVRKPQALTPRSKYDTRLTIILTRNVDFL